MTEEISSEIRKGRVHKDYSTIDEKAFNIKHYIQEQYPSWVQEARTLFSRQQVESQTCSSPDTLKINAPASTQTQEKFEIEVRNIRIWEEEIVAIFQQLQKVTFLLLIPYVNDRKAPYIIRQ